MPSGLYFDAFVDKFPSLREWPTLLAFQGAYNFEGGGVCGPTKSCCTDPTFVLYQVDTTMSMWYVGSVVALRRRLICTFIVWDQ